MLIHRGLAALARAASLGELGPYGLQAAIAACHARARVASETDWIRIAALYSALVLRAPSPVVELNHAVAIGMAFGAEPALVLVDALRDEGLLAQYYLLPSVRGDLLEKIGRFDEAAAEFEAGGSLTHNERERTILLDRAQRARRHAAGVPPASSAS
jgi:predicted RNA polymerase sigma factor